MSLEIEDLRYVARFPLEIHKIVIDAFIALDYDLDRITISKGVYQEDAKLILLAYGFVKADQGRFEKLPQRFVNEYVEHFYPGIDCANPQNADINLDMYLNAYHPSWMDEKPDGHPRHMKPFGLTREEQEIIDGGYRNE